MNPKRAGIASDPLDLIITRSHERVAVIRRALRLGIGFIGSPKSADLVLQAQSRG